MAKKLNDPNYYVCSKCGVGTDWAGSVLWSGVIGRLEPGGDVPILCRRCNGIEDRLPEGGEELIAAETRTTRHLVGSADEDA